MTPAVSVGLAVRNAQDVIDRCVESILSQDFADLELVVCDNASDDETVTILQRIAADDSRLRLIVNETNIGSHENMNSALEQARGTFFRWISSDDWLEPRCLSTCIATLRGRDDAIGVTTDFTIHTPDGATRFEDYRGEFPTSPDAARRFSRMLWFFHAGDAKYDPSYGVYRRDVLLGTRRLRRSEQTDWLMAAELALRGPIVHVHERLSHRTRSYRSRRPGCPPTPSRPGPCGGASIDHATAPRRVPGPGRRGAAHRGTASCVPPRDSTLRRAGRHGTRPHEHRQGDARARQASPPKLARHASRRLRRRCLVRSGACLGFDALQPGLAPVREDLPRAEPAADRALPRARDALEDDAVTRDFDHATRAVVHDALHPCLDPVGLSAARKHLAIEREPPVQALRIQGRDDLLRWSDPYDVSGREPERKGRSACPRSRRAASGAFSPDRTATSRYDRATCAGSGAVPHVPGPELAPVLPRVRRLQRLGRRREPPSPGTSRPPPAHRPAPARFALRVTSQPVELRCPPGPSSARRCRTVHDAPKPRLFPVDPTARLTAVVGGAVTAEIFEVDRAPPAVGCPTARWCRRSFPPACRR